MRELSLNPSNGGVTKTIRSHAARMGLDTSHFRNNRSWSDGQLREALTESRTWEEVLTALGLSGNAGGERVIVKGHAARLGIDTSHLGKPAATSAAASDMPPDLANLRFAAESIASAWFALRGCGVCFPVIPSAHDLLVSSAEGIQRVQVKTTTRMTKDGWIAQISRRPYSFGNRVSAVPYDPEEVDLFFVVDGDLMMYVIPILAVAGRGQILLRAYKKYIVGNACGLWGPASRAA
jgi:hypothetical protein